MHFRVLLLRENLRWQILEVIVLIDFFYSADRFSKGGFLISKSEAELARRHSFYVFRPISTIPCFYSGKPKDIRQRRFKQPQPHIIYFGKVDPRDKVKINKNLWHQTNRVCNPNLQWKRIVIFLPPLESLPWTYQGIFIPYHHINWWRSKQDGRTL
jgi:hypothetical protein